MRKLDIALIFFLVAIIGWIIYKETVGVSAAPLELIDEEEKPLPEEDRVKDARERSEEALNATRNSEIKERLDEYARFVAELEATLATTQSKAILDPTNPEAKREAAQAEVKSEQARGELESRWRSALAESVTQMEVAESAAVRAIDAHQSALYKVDYWEKECDKANEKIQILNTRYQQVTDDPTLSRQYLESIQGWRRNWEYYRKKIVETRNAADRVRVEAVATISNANLCVERVLTITADVRLLGILLGLASRTDSIARATRAKLEDLEIKLGG